MPILKKEGETKNNFKFIDYIPIYEIINYRHLFAHGFYVERVLHKLPLSAILRCELIDIIADIGYNIFT